MLSSRVNIVAVHVGAVKIYVGLAAVKALRKKERQDETQLPPKLMGFWVSPTPPHPNANVFICRFFFNITPFMTKLRVLVFFRPMPTLVSPIYLHLDYLPMHQKGLLSPPPTYLSIYLPTHLAYLPTHPLNYLPMHSIFNNTTTMIIHENIAINK
jgi:hypothetical protein